MTRYSFVFAASLLAALVTVAGANRAVAAGIPANIKAAVADSSRPDADKERDANRKPAETLAFADVKAGQQVAELIPGGGYFSRIFSKAVGPKGHVTAVVPPRPANAAADAPDRNAPIKALAADSNYSNLSVEELAMGKMTLATPVDLVFTAQNYHDLHNSQTLDVATFNKSVFDALKPGGLYVVLDHSAEAGSGSRDTSTLHRIDAATVKQEVTAAGFEFVGASDVLKNSTDTHTAKVFDPTVRGKTDQFILKFRKPKK
jgi:predicted methyltransferase